LSKKYITLIFTQNKKSYVTGVRSLLPANNTSVTLKWTIQEG